MNQSACVSRAGSNSNDGALIRQLRITLYLCIAICCQCWIRPDSDLIAAEPVPPTLAEVVASGADLWGELALKQPNGPSYEFFAPLLPPPRYVHADFRHYPLVLSAPGAKTKARLISNGSGVNLRGGSRSWKIVGYPIVFRVGPDEFRFGDLPERLSGPVMADGWLPIYEITYRHPYPVQAEGFVPLDQQPRSREAEVYRLEAFVSTAADLAENAVVFIRFSLAAGSRGTIAVQFDPPHEASFAAGIARDMQQRAVAYFDPAWKWERQGARAELKPGGFVTLAILTKPLEGETFRFDSKTYGEHRTLTENTWRGIVQRGMQVEVPEPRINNAWRNLLVQNFMLRRGDLMLYSAGNQYEQLYEAEGSDAALALMAWGFESDAKQMLVPLLDFTRRGLENHQAGIKLQDVIRYWWQTRDADWVRQMQPRWQKELQRILEQRNENGLLPKERYAGDISTPVHSLNVEAKAYRALRDLPPVLRAIGQESLAEEVSAAESQCRTKLLEAIHRSVRRDSTPPFVPMALLADEPVHSPITATRIGSYWNLMMNYVLGSRLFPSGSDEETWIPKYLEQHGGLCMGMTRSGGTAHGFWTGSERVNPLYGTRYVLDTLRRDDPERALVSFYGMLAQGLTRDTFIAGEGCTLAPVDAGGRFFYCPPNSAGNAHFLTMLKALLVQELDADDDGQPETLRLLCGTSRRWLDDGTVIRIERAPTAFGVVSVLAESHLQAGHVSISVELPDRNPIRRIFLRARVPEGWRIESAELGQRKLMVDERGTVDLSGERGRVAVRFLVTRT